jgi:uncharacterized protein with HEPN domain
MTDREYRDFVNDIIESIDDISQFVAGMTYDDFVIDKKTINAVIRSMEIIGEASKNMPDFVKIAHENIPWKKMSGMRDRLIHGYFGIDNEILWKTVKQDLPSLLLMIVKLREK